MRKFTITTLLFFIALAGLAQDQFQPVDTLVRQKHLQKASSLKQAGLITGLSGMGCVGVATILYIGIAAHDVATTVVTVIGGDPVKKDYRSTKFAAGALAIGGCAAIITGAGLMISAKSHKKKAMSMSLQMEQGVVLHGAAMNNVAMPAVTVRWKF